MSNTETLNPNALAQLQAIGFDAMELGRIKANNEVIKQVNEFFKEPHANKAFAIDEMSKGAYFRSDKNTGENTIYFPNNTKYLTYDTLVHELGHALGKRQPEEPSHYKTPEEYAKAVAIGEAEAILNEYRILEIDRKNPNISEPDRAFNGSLSVLEKVHSLLNGRDIEQLPKEQQNAVYEYLAEKNNSMTPSSFDGYTNELTYHEKSIIAYLNHSGQWGAYLHSMGKSAPNLETLMQDEQIFRDTKIMLEKKLYDQTTQLDEKINASKITQGVLAFGGEGVSTITGSQYDDKLIAGQGENTIIGGKGNDILHGGVDNDRDILKGGADNDTYHARTKDVIEDHEGKNTLFFEGKEIKGKMIQQENSAIYKSESGLFLEKQGSDLLLYNDERLKENSLRIKNFQNGDFGIELKDNPKQSISQENRVLESVVSLDMISPASQKLFEACHQKLVSFCHEKGITADSPQDFTNIAAALAAKGVVEHDMKKVDKMDMDMEKLNIFILSYEPHAKLTSVNANEAVHIPAHESFAKIHQTEQQQAQLAQEREMNQNQLQQRGMSLV